MRGYILVILIMIIGLVQAAKITVDPAGENIPVIQKAVDNARAATIGMAA